MLFGEGLRVLNDKHVWITKNDNMCLEYKQCCFLSLEFLRFMFVLWPGSSWSMSAHTLVDGIMEIWSGVQFYASACGVQHTVVSGSAFNVKWLHRFQFILSSWFMNHDSWFMSLWQSSKTLHWTGQTLKVEERVDRLCRTDSIPAFQPSRRLGLDLYYCARNFR